MLFDNTARKQLIKRHASALIEEVIEVFSMFVINIKRKHTLRQL